MKPRLIIHGGAWNIPESQIEDHIKGIERCLSITYPKLQKGATALDAVETAINLLELDPTYDAGRGAFLNEEGEIELDAIIMDGKNLDFGAVAALQNILHPVSVARKVMEKTDHTLLVGQGALAFAKKMKFQEEVPTTLLTDREIEYYNAIKKNPNFKSHHPFGNSPSDTVGAVALDQNGNLAVATSTGGTPRKLAGRVGDSPIPGAGAYADNTIGAVSATGWGESIMKVCLSKTVIDLLPSHPAKIAAQKGIQLLQEKVNGLGGIIGISAAGNYLFAHNTPKMAFGLIDDMGQIVARIKVDEKT